MSTGIHTSFFLGRLTELPTMTDRQSGTRKAQHKSDRFESRVDSNSFEGHRVFLPDGSPPPHQAHRSPHKRAKPGSSEGLRALAA